MTKACPRLRPPRLVRPLRPCLAGVSLAALLWGCGRPEILVSADSYEPRIVIDGILIPGRPVDNIRITRNVPVDRRLTNTDLVLRFADVAILDAASGRRFPLTFHSGTLFVDNYFEYTGKQLQIDYGGTYSIEVSATVDGRQLHTRATTTVPRQGFEIVGISRDRTPYRPRSPDGDVEEITVEFERSPGTGFYLLTVRPLTATQRSFIYDNPFTDQREGKVDLDDFNYEWEWLQNTPVEAGRSSMTVFWWDLWFYSRYEIVIFAADDNYARFIQTFDEVQEPDGNFHEPVFNLEGDGIGYFGAAIADTVMLEITR